MRVASWNVNSVRARADRVRDWLLSQRPDVLCLQELKCQDEAFPAELIESAGYQAVTHGQKTYNGVAILARTGLAVSDVVRGLQDDADDPQARIIAATVSGVRVICIYAPNGQSLESPAYEYKLAWFRRLQTYLDQRHSDGERLVLCGDFNIAPDDRDVFDPSAWQGSVLTSEPERQALTNLLARGMQDTFRLHHSEGGRFSWWDYRQLAFPRNDGLRIDLILATDPLAARCTLAEIDREARKGKQPSDHTVVWAEFDVDSWLV